MLRDNTDFTEQIINDQEDILSQSRFFDISPSQAGLIDLCQGGTRHRSSGVDDLCISCG